MFKNTKSNYKMIRSSGISPVGSVLMTAFLFVVMPIVDLWYKEKLKKDKNV